MSRIVEHHVSKIIKLFVAHYTGPHEGRVRYRYSKLYTHEGDKGVVGEFSSAGEGVERHGCLYQRVFIIRVREWCEVGTYRFAGTNCFETARSRLLAVGESRFAKLSLGCFSMSFVRDF